MRAESPVNLPRPLEGTFIQLTDSHRQWNDEKWEQLFASFQKLRLKHLVVQWTEYDNVSFYPTPGIGTGKLDLNTLPLYLEAARRATEAEHCELGVIVEMFQQIDAQFAPAPLERIVRQLGIASHEYPKRVFGFSVPEYMSPLGGAEAERLFAEYVAALP